MEELIHKYLDNDVVRVINGSVKESTKVLELKWDHSMYRWHKGMQHLTVAFQLCIPEANASQRSFRLRLLSISRLLRLRCALHPRT